MIWRAHSIASGSVVRPLRRCVVLLFLISLSACATDNHNQEPAAEIKAEKPAPLARIAAKPPEVIPAEPPLPVEKTPLGLRGRHKPYHINGKTYYPLVTAKGYEERGMACLVPARPSMGTRRRAEKCSICMRYRQPIKSYLCRHASK